MAKNLIKNKRTLIKLVVCFSITIFLYVSACIILTPKSIEDTGGPRYYRGVGFKSEPENSLDLVVYGNSDVYSGFAPSVIYSNHGYTSYASGRANQTVGHTLNLLKETISEQNPKVVILETDCFYEKRRQPLDSTNILIAPFVYHSRWKEISGEDFKKLPLRKNVEDINKGYIPSSIVKPVKMSKDYMGKPTQKAKPLPQRNKEEIEEFISICKDKNIEVIFLELPSPVSWNYSRHNAVKALAEKHKIPFLDLNIPNEDYAVDLKHDFRDNGNHLNIIGAERATKYIGEYIKENYGNKFLDKRGDERYSHWNKTTNSFKKIKELTI